MARKVDGEYKYVRTNTYVFFTLEVVGQSREGSPWSSLYDVPWDGSWSGGQCFQLSSCKSCWEVQNQSCREEDKGDNHLGAPQILVNY